MYEARPKLLAVFFDSTFMSYKAIHFKKTHESVLLKNSYKLLFGRLRNVDFLSSSYLITFSTIRQ